MEFFFRFEIFDSTAVVEDCVNHLPIQGIFPFRQEIPGFP